jgi:hypothetical protein
MHAEYGGKALKRIDYETLIGHNQMELASDKPPKYFYDRFDGTNYQLYVAPKPAGNYANTALNCIFSIQTSNIALIPDQYQPHIFLYAFHKAKIKERQWQDSSLALQTYYSYIKFARADALERGQVTIDKFRDQ